MSRISCLFLLFALLCLIAFVATQNKATTKRLKCRMFCILICAPVLSRITLKTTKISLKIVLLAKMLSMDPALDSGVSHIGFIIFLALIRFLYILFFLKPEKYCFNEDVVYLGVTLCLLHMFISVFISISNKKVHEVHSNCRPSRA